MKILLANLDTTITNILKEIRTGVKNACDEGIIAELPEKVDFQMEVVIGNQTLEELVTTADSKTGTQSAVKPEATTTTVKTGGGQNSIEQISTSNAEEQTDSTIGDNTRTLTYF